MTTDITFENVTWYFLVMTHGLHKLPREQDISRTAGRHARKRYVHDWWGVSAGRIHTVKSRLGNTKPIVDLVPLTRANCQALTYATLIYVSSRFLPLFTVILNATASSILRCGRNSCNFSRDKNIRSPILQYNCSWSTSSADVPCVPTRYTETFSWGHKISLF